MCGHYRPGLQESRGIRGGDWGVERDLFLRTSSQVGQRVWFKFQRMKVLLNLDTEKGHILLLKKGG